LSERVDAGIGAAGALRESFFASEVFESGHQRPLNGQSVGLDLPSGEIVAIVCEREFEIAWQIGTWCLKRLKNEYRGPAPLLTLFNA
jgi:hypothetical protein